MQQTQQNCWLLSVALFVLITASAMAASTTKPDPLLAGASGPCDPKLDGADYVAGADVDGNPVTAADLPHEKVPVPDSVLVPIGGERGKNRAAQPQAYAELGHQDMDEILHPKSACSAERKAR